VGHDPAPSGAATLVFELVDGPPVSRENQAVPSSDRIGLDQTIRALFNMKTRLTSTTKFPEYAPVAAAGVFALFR